MTPRVILSQNLFFREIPLTQGQWTLVSAEDHDWLTQWKWQAAWRKHCFYACRQPGRNERGVILMHREILGLKFGDKRVGDHIDLVNTLDNRRENLRIANMAQNGINRRAPVNNTSGYKGVSWHAGAGKWRAVITWERKQVHLGFFAAPEDAHAAYCVAAKQMYGEFARTA